MNLSYSAEYEQYRAEVRRFLAEHWTPEDAAATVSDPSSVATGPGRVLIGEWFGVVSAAVRAEASHRHAGCCLSLCV